MTDAVPTIRQVVLDTTDGGGRCTSVVQGVLSAYPA